ncbi:MAG TPA: GNAT family N-acetyltransferase [Steroidobacteraceae bacterium]|nr:GNAT family N-acetyltransferase [Steroidobacteraceae bacterium]
MPKEREPSRRPEAAARSSAAHVAATQTLDQAVVHVRPIQSADIGQVIAIDAEVTGIEKTDYWYELYRRYGASRTRQRMFLVAESGGAIQGFVIGEVRDWEFGSPPCGWVFGISVRPGARLAGLGTRLLEAMCDSLRYAGVNRVRTLVARDNTLVLSFFRSQAMTAAPAIILEKTLEP